MTHPFWRQMVLSFSSGSFYKEIAPQPFSWSLRYLVLLVFTTSIFLSARYSVVFTRFLGEAEVWAQKHLPEIRIEGGEVTASVPQPWRYEEAGRFIAILDTTGKTQEIPSEFPQGLLLAKDRLTLKRGPVESRRYDLSKVESFRLNAEVLKKFREKGKWVFWPLLCFGFFGYFIVAKFCQVVLFSLISVVTNQISGRFLPYRALLNIGIYALTLPFLLASGIFFWGHPVTFFGLVFVAVYGALLVTAVLHCAPPREAMPERSDL